MQQSAATRKLAELGLVLPGAAAPVANYVPCIRSGSWLIVSGQLPFGRDGLIDPAFLGKLGAGVAQDAGALAARQCALNLLAQAEAALGTLDTVARVLRLGGFINCAPDFGPLASVMNGASDLMVAVFGEAGRHARSTIGVAQLPLDAAVEVEALFEIAP